MGSALLIIDPQNDFCDTAGSLYVPNADKDMTNLAEWIGNNKKDISHILVTGDCHPVKAIFHPIGFENPMGKHPAPFTQISLSELESLTWIPAFDFPTVRNYLTKLEQGKGIRHTIWPEHCINGSWGMEIYPPIQNALNDWEEHSGGKIVKLFKGQNPLSEHYGAFKPEVQDGEEEFDEYAVSLLDELNKFEKVYVAGEAESHCVTMSINQICEYSNDLAAKLVIMNDYMSPVPGFESQAEPIFEKAKKLGAVFL